MRPLCILQIKRTLLYNAAVQGTTVHKINRVIHNGFSKCSIDPLIQCDICYNKVVGTLRTKH